MVSKLSQQREHLLDSDKRTGVMTVTQKPFEELHNLPERELPFTLEEYEQRQNRVREMMDEAGLEMIYVTSPEGMFYLSGYRASWYQGHSPTSWPPIYGIGIHRTRSDLIHIDIPTEIHLIDYVSVPLDKRLVDRRGNIDFVVETLKKEGWLKGRVGFEMWSYRPNRVVSERMQRAFEAEGAEVVDASRIIREVKRIKSPKELEYIDKAGEILDAGLCMLRDEAQEGMTELELYALVNYSMARAGGEPTAMVCSFASGSRGSAGGHMLPSRKKLQRGEVFGVDACGVYNQYHTNVVRTFFLGDPPSEAVERYQLIAQARKHMESIIKPDMTVRSFNRQMREFYEAHGIWGERHWVGGYELGASFPPDWVGEWMFSVEDDYEETEKILERNFVCNYENNFRVPGTAWGDTAIIDTLVFRDQIPVIPSSFDGSLVVID
jgi:Xaa-Pro aminopeptidase